MLKAVTDSLSDINNLSAASTAVIAAFTIILALVGWRQARLIRKSIELGNKEFIATHRPKLRVRQFVPRLNDGLPVAVHFIVVNVGDSNAHIKGFDTTIGLQTMEGFSFRPMIAPMESRSLKGGEAALYISVAPDLTYLDEWGITRNVQGVSFEFRGEIEYADDNGLIRRTGFWRVRDLHGRMRRRDDPEGDHEYED